MADKEANPGFWMRMRHNLVMNSIKYVFRIRDSAVKKADAVVLKKYGGILSSDEKEELFD